MLSGVIMAIGMTGPQTRQAARGFYHQQVHYNHTVELLLSRCAERVLTLTSLYTYVPAVHCQIFSVAKFFKILFLLCGYGVLCAD